MPDIANITFPPIVHLSKSAIRQSKFDVSREIEERAKLLLESHPHFRGRSRWVQCRHHKGRVYLTGKVPTYYLKQLAQEAVRDIGGVDMIVNRITVGSPVGDVEQPNQRCDAPSTTGEMLQGRNKFNQSLAIRGCRALVESGKTPSPNSVR